MDEDLMKHSGDWVHDLTSMAYLGRINLGPFDERSHETPRA